MTSSASQDRGIEYSMTDEYWDQFAYAPYARPNLPDGTAMQTSHGDRRVVGFQHDQLTCVTDLPEHYALPHEIRAFQWFTSAGDFVHWIVETCRRTRFTAVAVEWSDSERFECALAATLFGLEWDLDGNVLVDNPQASVSDRRKPSPPYLLVMDSFSSWRILDATGRSLREDEIIDLLPMQLFDIASDDPLDFSILA